MPSCSSCLKRQKARLAWRLPRMHGTGRCSFSLQPQCSNSEQQRRVCSEPSCNRASHVLHDPDVVQDAFTQVITGTAAFWLTVVSTL